MNRVVVAIIISLFATPAVHANQAEVIEQYGNIPLAFTINSGQYDPQVKFSTRGSGCTMFFTQEGATFLLSRETKRRIESRTASLDEPVSLDDTSFDREQFALAVRFLNANPAPDVTGEEPLPWKSNYIIGNNPDNWATDVANYKKVRLQNIYDGIDLVYYGNNTSLKYDFVVQPGRDPAQICLAYDFGDDRTGCSLDVNDAGELVVSTPLGTVVERKPYCYQVVDGAEVIVDVRYHIENAGAGQFSFNTAAYNPMYELVIDPEIVYSTFLGGTYTEFGLDITVDSNENAYLTGYTTSTDFPTTSGIYDESYNYDGVEGTNSDVFVAKMNNTGTALLYSTYIGGSMGEEANALVIDSNGNVYIAGWTGSSDFPTTTGVYDESINDSMSDGFITKLSSDGSSLLYSTFIGGSNNDILEDIAIDSSGNAYVTGWTYSSDYPITIGAYDTSYSDSNGPTNIIVSKLNISASDLVYSTYFGNGSNKGLGIVVDSSGNAYVTGHYGTSAFVAKFDANASELIYNKLLGTGVGYDIIISSNDNTTVTGHTFSSSFPTSSSAYDQTHNGGRDVFISTLDAFGNKILYSTFLGGAGSDQGRAITKDSDGNIYITGATWSSNFPTTSDAYDDTWSGDNYDAYLAKFNPTLSNLQFSTFLGGYDNDIANGIAHDGNDNLYVIGHTVASDYPTTVGAYDTAYNGGEWDAFVIKNSFALPSEVTLTSPNGSEDWSALQSYDITWTSQSVSTVKLDYSLDNGTEWTTIEKSLSADTGTYSWTLPDTTSSLCLVRITNTEDAEVTDQSEEAFSIYLPSVTVTSPNGGEVWKVFINSIEQITWSSEYVDNVKVEYSINNGSSWKVLKESYAASIGSYMLYVPDTTSTECLVRVTDTANSTATDQSDTTFIMRREKKINLLYPDNGDTWVVGETYEIKWTSQNLFFVKLEYSTDGGENWTLIADSIPEIPYKYDWIIPDTVSTNCFVRISDVSETIYNDTNDIAFTIASKGLTLQHPNEHSVLKANHISPIEWYSANIDSVKLEYSSDSGESWHIIIEKTDATNGSYDWMVPDINSTDCIVRISDTEDPVYTDQNEDLFTIYKPTVTSPNGGESWSGGSSHAITWLSSWVNDVIIEYSIDSGASWYTIVTKTDASTGLYSWVLPDNPSTTCLVKISDASDAELFDVSNEVFTIEAASGPPSITVISPNGGENLTAGSTELIRWTSTNVDTVKIEYWSVQTGFNPIKSFANAPIGSCAWRIPHFETEGWKIRISSITDPSVFDESDNSFIVTHEPKVITIISPNGREIWKAGLEYEILWECNNYDILNIDYSLDEGANWINIANTAITVGKQAETNSIYRLEWIVPDTTSYSCLVRVLDTEDESIFDVSDKTFTIITDDPTFVESEPSTFMTSACYPNPFNLQTTISYQLPESADVTITVYNSLGQRVREYAFGIMEPGTHKLMFDASDLTSGLYIYRIIAGREAVTGKMLYMK